MIFLFFTGSQHERPILLKPHPVNTSVEVGGRASLQCRVRSELPPTVKWIKRLSSDSLRAYTGQLPNNTLQIDGNYYLFLPTQEVRYSESLFVEMQLFLFINDACFIY